ncbi:MAG: metallophosphoesterase [bacterium]
MSNFIFSGFILLIYSQITGYSMGDPWLQFPLDNSITVVWEQTSGSPWVDFGLTKSYGIKITGVLSENNYSARVVLPDLSPGQTYFYQTSSGRTGQFVTPALEDNDLWSFIHFGDSREGPEDLARNLSGIADLKTPANFIIHGGDVTRAGTYTEFTSEWLKEFELSPVKNTPLVIVKGNHDGSSGFQRFDDRLSPIPGRYYYSFDHKNAHFSIINSNFSNEFQPGTPMYDWLERDLQSTGKPWKIVALHHTWHGVHKERADGAVGRLNPLFAAQGVDLVLCSHDHNFQINKPEGGVRWIHSGGAGAGMYWNNGKNFDVLENWQQIYHFIELNIKGNHLRGKVWNTGCRTEAGQPIGYRDNFIGYGFHIDKGNDNNTLPYTLSYADYNTAYTPDIITQNGQRNAAVTRSGRMLIFKTIDGQSLVGIGENRIPPGSEIVEAHLKVGLLGGSSATVKSRDDSKVISTVAKKTSKSVVIFGIEEAVQEWIDNPQEQTFINVEGIISGASSDYTLAPQLSVTFNSPDMITGNLNAVSLFKESYLEVNPNPFRGNVVIQFHSNSRQIPELRIYDLKGKIIWSFDKNRINAGYNRIIWRAGTMAGARAASGVYVIQLNQGGKILTKTVTLVR